MGMSKSGLTKSGLMRSAVWGGSLFLSGHHRALILKITFMQSSRNRPHSGVRKDRPNEVRMFQLVASIGTRFAVMTRTVMLFNCIYERAISSRWKLDSVGVIAAVRFDKIAI